MSPALKRCCLAAAMAATALALAASASAVGSGDPALCLNGGWQTLQKDDGGHFKSEQACVRYAEHGGVLFSPRLTIIPYCGITDHVASGLGIFAFGFPAGSVVTLTLEGAVWSDSGSNVRTSITGGPHSFEPGALIIQPNISPTAEVLTLTMRSAEGIDATASVRTGCPFP